MIWNCSDYSVVFNKVLEVPFSLSNFTIFLYKFKKNDLNFFSCLERTQEK